MRFSLITVTMGDRPEAIDRLKASLALQTYRDFEHIVIDQRKHHGFEGGLSRARNHGLSWTTGDVVAFPDDDAWYAPSVLKDAAAALSENDVDGVSFRVTNETGVCSAGGYMSSGRMPMSRGNIWRTTVNCSFFVKRGAVGNRHFDERLGVGSDTRFGSEEKTDFILRMMTSGTRFVYDGTRTVFHPRPSVRRLSCVDCCRRGWLYDNGCGLVLRRDRYGLVSLGTMAAAQLVRAGQSVFGGRFGESTFHLAMSVGRISGYVVPLKEGVLE